MEFLEVMKIMKRMCRADESECTECPFDVENNGINVYCEEFVCSCPEKAEEILTKWADEHPHETILTDFLKKHPKAMLNDDGTPTGICPHLLGYAENKNCNLNFEKDCVPCWNRPLEDE